MTSRLALFLAATSLSLAGADLALAQTPEATAAAALEAAPVFDGHNDVPYQLRERFGNRINDFGFEDTLATATTDPNGRAMHTDLTRIRQGKLGAQFW